MPYVIINDKADPPHVYYTGEGFRHGEDTSTELEQAKRFHTIEEAQTPMRQGRAVLYGEGWRIVPVTD